MYSADAQGQSSWNISAPSCKSFLHSTGCAFSKLTMRQLCMGGVVACSTTDPDPSSLMRPAVNARLLKIFVFGVSQKALVNFLVSSNTAIRCLENGSHAACQIAEMVDLLRKAASMKQNQMQQSLNMYVSIFDKYHGRKTYSTRVQHYVPVHLLGSVEH